MTRQVDYAIRTLPYHRKNLKFHYKAQIQAGVSKNPRYEPGNQAYKRRK
jgi:hypothetical protein